MILGALTTLYDRIDLQTAAYAIPGAILVAHLIPWLWDPQGIRSYPGPFFAKFTDIWLGYVSKKGHRSEVIHEVHRKYGPIVRIAPNHISIADPDALAVVYAHGNGATKSNFYDAFVSIRRGVFNVRDRNEHTRKRKIISHIFSQKNVMEFEPHIRLYVTQLLQQWDRLFGMAVKGLSGDEGESGWKGRDGRLWFDLLPWANYLAFDIIGDLAFGAPFGMIQAAKDVALVPKDQQSMMKSYGKEAKEEEMMGIPAVKILNGRGEFSMSLGSLPPHWRPIVRRLPGWRQGGKDVKNLAGIAIAAVSKRLATPVDRTDLLSNLQAGRDGDGNPLGREELTAEALTLLIAGSDTTSNSTCAILYYLAGNRYAQEKLHKELDEQLGTEDEVAATEAQVKRLPYLEACINEGLRLHSTSSLGLPRLVPEGGMTVCGQFFPEGTVLSVPSYTIHRDPTVWGEDVELFRPERWFEGDQAAMQKTFNPFSVGPRACVGRNLASLELLIIIASITRRYDFVLEDPDQKNSFSCWFIMTYLSDVKENTRPSVGAFHQAHHIALNQPMLVENMISNGEPVLQTLKPYTDPRTYLDSSARHPPPSCHLNTRRRVREKLTSALDDQSIQFKMIWLRGPADTGKSAVAQTLAMESEEKGRFSASIFLSRTRGWDKYHTIVNDPQLLDKSPPVQFTKLIIHPFYFLQISGRTATLRPLLIVLDGLDECESEDAQCELIYMIANALRTHKDLPLFWLICSRTEEHLQYAFAEVVECARENLAIDAECRADVEYFLRSEFVKIRAKYRNSVPVDWPAETDFEIVVRAVSGLFIFASTVMKDIGSSEHANPFRRLQGLLSFLQQLDGLAIVNLLQALDLFYALAPDPGDEHENIMEQLRRVIQKREEGKESCFEGKSSRSLSAWSMQSFLWLA
ncbi:hypothetical protein NP233_g7498 [Leucocoprinus birnbaumii]|uniref:Uncharacterized protein n=1 Tax=Leucocoprinus birnbaumii TaxID=56174 RepID=A0AAD5VRR8_9AGAR|nr:hypothetical protein NP233_g7498 [Leucocoprinus birnbaumii]